MTSIICSAVFIVIILATSVLFHSKRNRYRFTNKHRGRAVAPVISKNNNKVTVDKFGIREIYPTKSNGTEWYINMSSPLNDKSFSLSGGGEKTSNSSLANATSLNGHIIKEPDGSYQVYGVRKTGKYDFSVRMNVNASDIAKWWKNIEMTGYVKVVTDTSGCCFRLVCQRSSHISSSPCEGVAYHAGLRADGSEYWQKEIWHTGGYTDFRSNITATHSLLGRWVGLR